MTSHTSAPRHSHDEANSTQNSAEIHTDHGEDSNEEEIDRVRERTLAHTMGGNGILLLIRIANCLAYVRYIKRLYLIIYCPGSYCLQPLEVIRIMVVSNTLQSDEHLAVSCSNTLR